MNAKDEKIYYQKDNVLVTSTRAEMAGKTLVMSNITSVSLAVIPPDGGCATLIMIGGGLLVLVSLMALTSMWPIALIGVGIAILGYWLMPKDTTYAVNLSSSSGESRALQSPDKAYIEEIISAIKQAIVDSDVQKVETVASSQSSRLTDDTFEKLKSLNDMFAAGLITQQEYDAKKAEMLSRI